MRKIEEGDWFIDDTLQVRQAIQSQNDWKNSGKLGFITCYKIEATSDESLGKTVNETQQQRFIRLYKIPESFMSIYTDSHNNGKTINLAELEMEEFTTGQCSCQCHDEGVVMMHMFACCNPQTNYKVKTLPDNTVIIHETVMSDKAVMSDKTYNADKTHTTKEVEVLIRKALYEITGQARHKFGINQWLENNL